MELLDSRAQAVTARCGRGRRTRRVPGGGRAYARRADTKSEYFYIYAGDDPTNLTDPSGTTPWDPRCLNSGFADMAGHRALCADTARSAWCNSGAKGHFVRCYGRPSRVTVKEVLDDVCDFGGLALTLKAAVKIGKFDPYVLPFCAGYAVGERLGSG